MKINYISFIFLLLELNLPNFLFYLKIIIIAHLQFEINIIENEIFIFNISLLFIFHPYIFLLLVSNLLFFYYEISLKGKN